MVHEVRNRSSPAAVPWPEAAPAAEIEWCASADRADEEMRHDHIDTVPVTYAGRVIGHVCKDDLARMERCGNCLSSILVRDAMRPCFRVPCVRIQDLPPA